eukprot:c23593_g1_i1 orf=218-997(+)
MVLEALVHGSTMASCSSKVISPCRTSLRTSELPCNFFSPGAAKVSHTHGRLVVASKADCREPVCSQSLVSLPTRTPLINQKNVDPYKHSPFSERWIEDCIYEIVNHINEAPFLQLLFDSKDNSTPVTLQRQRVPAGPFLSADEKWKEMKNHVGRTSPDGVILVHHLHESSLESCTGEDGLAMDAKQRRDASNPGIETRNNGRGLWGVLVLGKSIAKSACYILETTSVASPFGTCTHFNLTEAQSFGPSWLGQIQRSWLC